MKVRFRFEPRDLWIGVYWNKMPNTRKTMSGIYTHDWLARGWLLDVYVCLLPTLVIHLQFYREGR